MLPGAQLAPRRRSIEFFVPDGGFSRFAFRAAAVSKGNVRLDGDDPDTPHRRASFFTKSNFLAIDEFNGAMAASGP